MFLQNQSPDNIDKYLKLLTATGALSRLFSESSDPYLSPRAHERIFCRSFTAYDRSRSDLSVDATKDGTGLGLKTFLNNNGKSFQKIAEFNADHRKRRYKNGRVIAEKISNLRNKRIEDTARFYNLRDMIYHCVVRASNKMIIYEAPMQEIRVKKISGVKDNSYGVSFSDGWGEYKFNYSKSTLFKKFYTPKIVIECDVRIIADPFNEILRYSNVLVSSSAGSPKEILLLPLYAIKAGVKIVHPKSGLNQSMAGGRQRHNDEVYIPIPAEIRKKHPNFFPAREHPFRLRLPNGKPIEAKICQQNDKALMSNPNKDLGQWLLRDVLRLPRGRAVTYKMLEDIGIDAVAITKKNTNDYEIDFRPVGSVEGYAESDKEHE